MLKYQLDDRISVFRSDDWIVVSIQGYELFDLIDDHCTALITDEHLVRHPEATSGPELHELLFPENVGLDRVIAVLGELPPRDRLAAESADDGRK